MKNIDFSMLTDADLKALKADGIVLKPGFFSEDQISKIRETSQRLRATAMAHKIKARKWLLTSPSYALRKCFKVDVRNDLVYLSQVTQACGFPQFSKKYYDQKVELDHIMSMESPRSETAIIAWHTDANSDAKTFQEPDNFTLKFFIYLNDIDASNGAFAYVRGTHRLVTVLRQGIFNGEIPYYRTSLMHDSASVMSDTTSMPDLRQALQNPQIITFLLKHTTQSKIDYFKAEIDCLKTDMIELEKHVLSGRAGTLLVFDDRGLHRGGVPRMGARSILRYNYYPAKYCRQRYPLTSHILNRACRFFLPKPLAAHWNIP